ncbi:hypothetical protein [Psychromonas aquimarina]|uniref:hypothetical protein n=1 Tax=Psychromonas aquimarina TaxID=444919 RepID=UPI0004904751|nr:hypothetical protein [Psychromonas aquimarina]
MRNILIASVILLVFSVSNNVMAVTHSCSCDITKVYAGFGGAGNSTKYKVECADGKSYSYGLVADELAKSRHSIALTSFAANKTLVLDYWSPDGALSCEAASSDFTEYPDGFYIK